MNSLDSKEKELEQWAKENKIELTPDLYLDNQRFLILEELSLVGLNLDLPGSFLASLNSRQFAEVVANAVQRSMKRSK